jgi:hypothetical protein
MHREKIRTVLDEPAMSEYSLEEIKKSVIEKWGSEVGSKEPTFFSVGNFGIKLFAPVHQKILHSNECVDFILTNNLFFPNAHGLVILEHLDQVHNFLPNDLWIIGLDHSHHLSFKKNFGHVIPFLKKRNSKFYEYGCFYWNTILEHDERFLAFYK